MVLVLVCADVQIYICVEVCSGPCTNVYMVLLRSVEDGGGACLHECVHFVCVCANQENRENEDKSTEKDDR